MPKRKRDSDIEKLSKKFRRLERKLKRAKRRRSFSTSSREDSKQSEHNNEAAENPMEFDDVTVSPDDGRKSTEPIPNVSRDQTAKSPPLPSAQAITQPPPPAHPPPPTGAALGPAAATTVGTAAVIVDDDLIEILGDDPSEITEFGKDIHTGLANRLQHIIVNGLDNDPRKELTKKYLIPANCLRICPPMLNAEIKAALPESSIKRDKGIENRQKQLGTAIACLSDVITRQMQEKDKNPALLKQLMDAIKLMCDTLHSDSVKRRYFALSTLKKDINDHLALTKIDKYLFGESLADTIKTARAVTKSGADIKVTFDKNKKNLQPQPSTSRGLNWKAPPSTRRQMGPQRSRQPYPPAGQRAPPPASRPPPPHAASSKTSRYQPRPNRR